MVYSCSSLKSSFYTSPSWHRKWRTLAQARFVRSEAERWPEVKIHAWIMIHVTPTLQLQQNPRPDLLTTLATFSKRKSHNICVQDGDKLIMNSEGPNMRSAALSSVYLQVQNHDRRSSWPTFYLQILAASIMTGLQYLFVQLMEDKGRNLLELHLVKLHLSSKEDLFNLFGFFFPKIVNYFCWKTLLYNTVQRFEVCKSLMFSPANKNMF